MTTLIKLTIAKTGSMCEDIEGQKAYVNTAQITSIYKWPKQNATVVAFNNQDASIHVEESPEEIAEMIHNAEHPFHQQKINVTDEVLAELKNAKPTLQVLPGEPSISYQ